MELRKYQPKKLWPLIIFAFAIQILHSSMHWKLLSFSIQNIYKFDRSLIKKYAYYRTSVCFLELLFFKTDIPKPPLFTILPSYYYYGTPIFIDFLAGKWKEAPTYQRMQSIWILYIKVTKGLEKKVDVQKIILST